MLDFFSLSLIQSTLYWLFAALTQFNRATYYGRIYFATKIESIIDAADDSALGSFQKTDLNAYFFAAFSEGIGLKLGIE